MVHRALLGSIERFFGVLIEHYGGAFPLWLSPMQIAVIPVAEVFNEYAENIRKQLKLAGFRVMADLNDDRLNAKIRKAQSEKIPYMIILGEAEKTSGTISVRKRSGEQIKELSVEDFIGNLKQEIENKR